MSDGILIRKALETDLSSLTVLEGLPESEFKQELAHIFVAEVASQIVGYVDYWKVKDEIQIQHLAVHPNFQKQGIGKCLIDKAKEEKFPLFLEVRVSNLRAIHFYQKQGFLEIGRRKAYYRDGEDALLMRF